MWYWDQSLTTIKTQIKTLQEKQLALKDFLFLFLIKQTALESQVFEEKDKAQRLQTELDVSEQVQRDFVKLSQTLQVNITLLNELNWLNLIND